MSKMQKAATTTSGNHSHDQDQAKLTKIAEQENRIVKEEEDKTAVDNSLPIMDKCAADEPTADDEQHANIPQEATKADMNQHQQQAAGLEEIRQSQAPLSVSDQFDKFNQAEANGVASPVPYYYRRPIPPALKKLNGVTGYNK